jgi:hypothetical protein
MWQGKKSWFLRSGKYIIRNCTGEIMAWIKRVNEKKEDGPEWFNSKKIELIYYTLQDSDKNQGRNKITREIIVKVKPPEFVIFQKTLELDNMAGSNEIIIEKEFQKKAEDVVKKIIELMGSNQMIDLKDKKIQL